MKKLLFLIFLISSLSSFAQADSTSRTDDVYLPVTPSSKEQIPSERKFGGSIFGGLGKGGNDYVAGFSYGGSARIHYGLHTLSVYAVQSDKIELFGGRTFHPEMSTSCSGLTYGVGAYSKNASGSIGVGVGYTSMRMKLQETSRNPEYSYNTFSPCLNIQLAAHGKYFGVGLHVSYNATVPVSSFAWLLGLELHGW